MLKPAVVILAAGRGTRMRSELPKAMHTMCGEPMLGVLLKAAEELHPQKIVVVAGYKHELVRDYVGKRAVVVRQKELLGSGHAVMQAKNALAGCAGPLILLYCDTPLVSAATMKHLLRSYLEKAVDCSVLTVILEDPASYGRMKRRADGFIEKIVEENDASETEKAIQEINAGSYVFNSKKLFEALKLVRQNPKKKEYYLTDVIEILGKAGKVEAVLVTDEKEVRGVNTRMDLAVLQQAMQEKILRQWIEKGVQIRDPRTTVIDADVKIGKDTVILPNTVIEDKCVIGERCVIGPFARLRGGSKIGDGAIVGNFVEIVRSVIGKNAQVKHLSYLGDAEVGSFVNVGAGTITANFDGRKKHKTIVKDGAQLGSGTVLIAPVTVGRKAKTGAGAVVTQGNNIPDGRVAVGVPAKILGRNGRKK